MDTLPPSTEATNGTQGTNEFNDLIGAAASGQAQTPGQTQTAAPNRSGLPQKTAAETDGGQQDGTQQTQDGQVDPNAAAGTPPANKPVDTNALQNALADAIAGGSRIAQERLAQQQQQTTAAAKAELTPEQFNQKYKVARANQELITTILGQDPVKAAAALNTYGQNLVQQAILMAMDVMDADVGSRFSKIEPEIKSWQTYQAQVREREAETRFFAKYPHLAAEKDIVMEMKDAVIARINAKTFIPKNEEEAFATVASACDRILTKYRPQGAGTAGAAGAPNGAATTPPSGPAGRQMSAASSAGRTGSGQKQAAKSDVEHIFGADAR